MKNRTWQIFAICSVLLMSLSSNAFAWGWARSLPPKHDVIVLRGSQYHYSHGRFYRPGPFGFFMVNPPIGIFVSILPPVHRTYIVGGVSYYYADSVYYTESVGGYVVVPPPVQNITVVESAPTATVETPPGPSMTINVPNSNGSFTPVKLVKYEGGYVGPQGEYYPGNPTVDQLRVLYGK
jgi:hypothetical protein